MVSICRLALGTTAAVFCAFIVTSAYADPPTVEGVWQQIDNGAGYVGGLISFKEKAGLWDGYIVKMYPKPGDPADRSARAIPMTEKTSRSLDCGLSKTRSATG